MTLLELLDPESDDITILQNFSNCLPVDTKSYHKRLKSSLKLFFKTSDLANRIIIKHKLFPATANFTFTTVNDLYSSHYIFPVIKSRIIRWAGHVASMGEKRGVYRDLVGKSEGRRSLGRPRRRWEDNIKMDLQEVVCEGMDWIEMVQDRDRCQALVSAVMNLRDPKIRETS